MISLTNKTLFFLLALSVSAIFLFFQLKTSDVDTLYFEDDKIYVSSGEDNCDYNLRSYIKRISDLSSNNAKFSIFDQEVYDTSSIRVKIRPIESNLNCLLKPVFYSNSIEKNKYSNNYEMFIGMPKSFYNFLNYLNDFRRVRYQDCRYTNPYFIPRCLVAKYKFDIHTVNHQKIVDKKNNDLKNLVITLSDEDLIQLTNLRDNALSKGYLERSVGDTFLAEGYLDNEPYLFQVRLKGDLLDHLERGRWSMRLRVKNNKSFLDMTEFSLQDPLTRSYNLEDSAYWFADKLNLIRPKTGYVNIVINGSSWGIMQYEETVKSLSIERQLYRNGVIINYDEDSYWDEVHLSDKNSTPHAFNYIENHNYSVAEKNRVFSNNAQTEQFTAAINKYEKYLDKEISSREVFDIEYTAKFLVLLDVFSAYHSLNFNNISLYYNPLNQKLYPILKEVTGIDPEFVPKTWYEKGVIDLSEYEVSPLFKNNYFYIDSYLLGEKKIVANDMYSFLSDKSIQDEYENFQSNILQNLNNEYKFLPNISYEGVLKKLSKISEGEIENNRVELSKPACVFYSTNNKKSLIKASISNNSLQLQNLTNTDLVVSQIRLFNQGQFKTLKINKNLQKSGTQNCFTKIINKKGLQTNTPAYVQIFIKNAETGKNFIQYLLLNDLENTEGFINSNSPNVDLIFEGNTVISKDLIINSSSTLEVLPGTEISFYNGSRIICYGTCSFIGTEDNKINFNSDGVSGFGGLFIIESPYFNMVNVNINSGSLNLKNVPGYTGLVSIYKTKANLEKINIINTNSEDGLNIISSDFKMDEIFIKNATSDAVDIDFSSGEINNIVINNPKGDGLDFSGSNLYINNVQINNSLDKAISVGEGTNVEMYNLLISNSRAGIVVKEGSIATIEGYTPKNNELSDVAAFRKKSYLNDPIVFIINKKNIVLNIKSDFKSKVVLNDEEVVNQGIQFKDYYPDA